MGSETTPAQDDVEPHVLHHIKQAGAAGLGFQQLLTQTELPLDTVIRAVVSHYTHGDIQCLLEAEDLCCVAR